MPLANLLTLLVTAALAYPLALFLGPYFVLPNGDRSPGTMQWRAVVLMVPIVAVLGLVLSNSPDLSPDLRAIMTNPVGLRLLS